ncbi:MAG: transposase [Colwellia sp.]
MLEQQLNWFKRQLFGRKSEKQLLDEASTQGSLFAKDSNLPSNEPTW